MSIDIAPIGYDKSQVIKEVKLNRNIPDGRYIFIGDRIEGGGNDYPLAKLMDNIVDCDWYHTSGWEETKQILENFSD